MLAAWVSLVLEQCHGRDGTGIGHTTHLPPAQWPPIPLTPGPPIEDGIGTRAEGLRGGSPQQQGGGVTVPFNDEDSRTYDSSEEIDH